MPITQTKLIKILRERADEYDTHKIAAKDMGINESTMCFTLNGRRDPSARVLAALGYRRVVRYEKVRE